MLGQRLVGIVAFVALLAVLGAAGGSTVRQPFLHKTAVEQTLPVQMTVADAFRGAKHYVAFGDSFTAGPFILPQRLDPIGCTRSSRNYPSLIAKTLEVTEFTDVSCGGAVTDNMTAPQIVPLGINPPQFDALRPDTDLVTVSIGGNDIGYTDIAYTCGLLSVTDPLGDPCRRYATAGGTDLYAERITATAPKVAAVLRGIEERSPQATVLLVGYLRVLPPAQGCWPATPISRGDVPYLDGVQRQLTTMLAEQAKAHGVVFVDPYAAALGRDACQLPEVRWVEGLVPTNPAYPVHPNAAGMRAVADLILGTLVSENPITGNQGAKS